MPILFSLTTISVCLLIGIPLRLVPRIQNWWLSRPILQIILLATGITLLFLSTNVNFKITELVNQDGKMIEMQFSNMYISVTGLLLTFYLLHLYPQVIADYFNNLFQSKNNWTKSPDR